jgi:hypothetical protein
MSAEKRSRTVKALKVFHHPKIGHRSIGQTWEAPPEHGETIDALIESKHVEEVSEAAAAPKARR